MPKSSSAAAPATPATPPHPGSPAHPETRGIDLVSDSERHGRARDLFAVWAAPNVSVLNFTIGATLTLVLGLEIWQALLVTIAAQLLWVLPGIVAVSGPAAGTSGSVIQRAIYGIRGNKAVIAIYGWFISGVFLALNWVASSFMGAELLVRLGFHNRTHALILVTIAVAAVTVLVAVYGHGLILRSYTFVTIALLVIFLLVTAFIAPQIDLAFTQAEPLSGLGLWSSLTIGFAILASTPLSYSNSADLARYLPRSTKPSHIVAATALGGAVPGCCFIVVGAALGTTVSNADASVGIEYVLLDMLPNWLGPLFVLGVVINTVALNGMTTYTASMAFQSIGVPIKRIPSAVLIGTLGTIFTIILVLSTSLLGAVNLMLQFLIIISAPTMAVYVTDILLRRNRYDGDELFDERPGGAFWFWRGVGLAGITAVTAGAGASVLFLSTDIWTGPLAVAAGHLDLSVPAGLLVAAATYVLLAAKSIRQGAAA
ncbi:purine-cytosine permease-like protein [Leucobacter luti]|uniref:purine-cytosine permease family protein n=1 Tax=Leucobacter luti TaxID=340320 RepID=UPI0010514500|nr:cytosine permease [Leucobacter luti]MCW2289060.1 purine-cytosine permease-like protein [Leucobacter luti]TCK35539.1 purine-cytosine permease-like protein [Leucobacter luti]